MSENSNGVLPTIVTITSLMENSRKYKYEFFIIVDNPTNIEYQKIKNLEIIYNRLTVNIIDHSPRTDQLSIYIPHQKHWPLAACYRLWLPNLLPQIDTIIHVDYDCLFFDDLDEMYNLNMNNINIRGIVDPSPSNNNKILRNYKYICSGVLLMNLKRMRETKIIQKYESFIMNFSNLLNYPDQAVINSVDIKHNDFLPLKFGILFVGINSKKYFRRIRVKRSFSIRDFDRAFANPVIAHYVIKPFRSFVNTSIYIKWWELALITCYSQEIIKKYNKTYFKYLPLLNQTFINERKSSISKLCSTNSNNI